jgi:hypothetical protein
LLENRKFQFPQNLFKMPPKRSASQPVNHVYVDAIQNIANEEALKNPDSKLRYVYIVILLADLESRKGHKSSSAAITIWVCCKEGIEGGGG